MKRNIPFALCLVLSLCSVAFAQQNWSDFRGPTMDGHAPAQADPPLKWSETENIKWKTAIHGEGWSSPVVWGDKLWVTTATEDGKKMSLVGLDANTGKVVRDIVVFENEAPQPMSNDRNTYASPSPVVEEGRVYVHFGHHGTAAVDSKSGEIIWKRRDLPCEHKEGSGASPAIYKDLLIFAHDGTERQRIIALNKNTGETVWKTTRSIDYLQWRFDLRKSFGTPIFVEVDGKTQVISSASKAVFAYDPATGEEIWKIRHDGFNGTPRPVVYKDLIFVSTGHMKAELWAMKLGGKGDVTDTHVAWTELRNVPLASSPIVVDDLLYMVADSGFLTCLDPNTGDNVWRQRLREKFAASPVYADGKIYLFGEFGTTFVIAPGREYKLLAENKLEDGGLASPAVVGKTLFLRTKTHVYAIEEGAGVAKGL